MDETIQAIAITGDTYPLRRELRARGAMWSYDEEAYLIPQSAPTAADCVAWAEEAGLRVTKRDVPASALEPETYAARRARKQARAAGRAETHSRIAGRLEADAAGREKAAQHTTDWAYITQPVSPNSAFGRMKARDAKNLDKASDARREAAERRGRAHSSARAAIADIDRPRDFMIRRIEEAEAEVRKLDRAIERITASGGEGERLKAIRDEEADKAAYWQELLAATGGIQFGPSTISRGDVVQSGRYKMRVLATNPKTFRFVIVEGGAKGSTGVRPYAEITEVLARGEKESGETYGPHNVAVGDRVVKVGERLQKTVTKIGPKTLTVEWSWAWAGGEDRSVVERWKYDDIEEIERQCAQGLLC